MMALRWLEMQAKTPSEKAKSRNFSCPPELEEKRKRLAEKGKLSEACCQGIKEYKED